MTNKEAAYILSDNCYDYSTEELRTAFNLAIKALEERPHGEWVAVDSYSAFGGSEETWLAHGNPIAMYYCSNCKNQAYANDMGEDILSKFCPHCGANMRGGRE